MSEQTTTKDPMSNLQCPHCQEKFAVALASHVPDEQRMTMTIEFESPFIAARTLGETISNTSELLVAVAKDVGSAVAVAVESISLEPRKATINFLLTLVKR